MSAQAYQKPDGHNVYLGLGSNIGDRFLNLRNALARLNNNSDIVVLDCSDVFLTKPWGYEKQEDFFNCCVKIKTHLNPYSLLSCVKEIEKELGRKYKENEVRYGPRIIDIDILLYDALCIKSDTLTIPHEHMYNRTFVLIPLSQICREIDFQKHLDTLEDSKNIKGLSLLF